jgi:multisubunit Na+/H+ antiporter MnhB subunit
MTGADWALDALLAAVLAILAWRVLAVRELAASAVLFISFGLLSALAWARLGAPDIALVEAAVGAGITGALLMSSLGAIAPSSPAAPASSRRWLFAAPALAAAIALASLLVRAIPHPAAGLGDEVASRLPEAGASHAVTAVLLDFRGYDTLLEILVLLAAAIIALASGERREAEEPAARSLHAALVRWFVPGIVLAAGYLLARGSSAPGGAFQAGAILGGGLILLSLARTPPPSVSHRTVRAALLVGPGFFVAVALAPLVFGRPALDYPSGVAGALVLGVEAALTISIALILAIFFPGALRLRPPARVA